MREKLNAGNDIPSRIKRSLPHFVVPDRQTDSGKAPVIRKIVTTARELIVATGDKPHDQRTDRRSTGNGGAENREPSAEGTQPPGKPPEGRVPSAGENGEDEPEKMATSEQLGNLYGDAKRWLVAHGKMVSDDKSKARFYRGLPIKEHPPHIEYTIPGDIVRKVTPKAAEILEVGDSMNVARMLPHYAPLMEPGRYEYKPEQVWFNIDKPPGHELISDALYIEAKMDTTASGKSVTVDVPKFVSDRLTESATLRTDEVTEDMDIFEQVATVRDVAGQELSRQVGGNLMTKREHQALSDIVNNLDKMRRRKEGVTDE